MDYTTLVGAKTAAGSIKHAVNHTEVAATDVLSEAEAWIYTRLRHHKMRELATGSVTITDTSISLPARYIATISFRWSGDYKARLKLVPIEDFEDRYAPETDGTPEPGQPRFGAIDGTAIQFNLECDIAYRYRHWYYKRPDALSGSNLTNFLTDELEHLLRAVTNAFAYRKLDDDQADKWLKIAVGHLEEAQAAADETMLSYADVELTHDYE